jgi:hypothetical protein
VVQQPDQASAVNVTLREFSVTVDQATVPHGSVTFHATNTGTVPHEFLVIKTDLAPDALPKSPTAATRRTGRARASRRDRRGRSRASKDLTITLDQANAS